MQSKMLVNATDSSGHEADSWLLHFIYRYMHSSSKQACLPVKKSCFNQAFILPAPSHQFVWVKQCFLAGMAVCWNHCVVSTIAAVRCRGLVDLGSCSKQLSALTDLFKV